MLLSLDATCHLLGVLFTPSELLIVYRCTVKEAIYGEANAYHGMHIALAVPEL